MWRWLRVKQQLRNHAPLRKHQQNEASESSSRPAVKNFAMVWRLRVKNCLTTGSLQRWCCWVRIPRTKERKFWWNQERLMSYGICHFLFWCLFFPGVLGLCVTPLGFLVWFVVLLRIRGFRDPNLWIHTSNSLYVVSCFSSLFWVHLRICCTAHCPWQWVCAHLAKRGSFISTTVSFFAGSWPLHSCL